MTEKSYKRVKLPKGVERLPVVKLSSAMRLKEEEYQKILEEDFDESRHLYRTVVIHGVPVKIKTTA